jgi:hypothetical protein
MQGLLLNFVTWIRDYWCLPTCGIPDKSNDEVQGSLVVRDSPKKLTRVPNGAAEQVCPKSKAILNQLI